MKKRNTTIAIIGAGNIGLSLAKGLVKSWKCNPSDITLTRRTITALDKFRQDGMNVTSDNVKAVKQSQIILLAVLPQQFNQLMAQIGGHIQQGKHTVISVVSGVSIAAIRQKLKAEVPVIRAMPNTAIAIGESMTCIAYDAKYKSEAVFAKELFDTVGLTMDISEEHITSATALCACGIAFFLRAIRAASQGGIQIGFHADEALMMAAQTAKGAASLLIQSGAHPEREIDKVTSPEGCTIAGLNEMEHQGLSSALIKGIITSWQKAGKLYHD